MSQQKRSEDVLGDKLDHCFADSVIKILSGAAIGTFASMTIFKAKRTWPILLGAGIGIGMGLSNCKQELRKPHLLHGKKVRTHQTLGKDSYQIVVQDAKQ